MAEEFSVAVFEDGTTEMIPKSWVQDFIKNDEEMTYTDVPNNEPNVYMAAPAVPLVAKPSVTLEEIGKQLQSISKVAAENKDALALLQRSVDRLICIATGEPEPELDLTHAAETLSELLAIEEHIKVKPNYDELVITLAKIGGRTVESTTRKIWNKLCTTKLASTICWTGANGKYCLKNLTLNKLVRDAVLTTHPQGKEADIQRATILWFSHAQDRLRAKKHCTAPNVNFFTKI